MNSIKSLITEKRKGLAILLKENKLRKELAILLKKNKFLPKCYSDKTHEYFAKCREMETLKLCQEIQDAQVKELKEELTKPIASPAMEPFVSRANYYAEARLKVLEKIDKIFGEETQALKS